MAVKEILDVLGENPTQAVYNEGKNFVTRKIKLYIDKEKLENYVKEAYNRQTIVYASKKFAYEGFMEYISSKAFINEVEEILVETDYVKREKRKSELIAEGISYIEKSDTIAQEQAKELMLIGIEAVLKYMSKQIEPSLRMVINNQAGDIICQVKKELNEAIQKLIQELKNSSDPYRLLHQPQDNPTKPIFEIYDCLLNQLSPHLRDNPNTNDIQAFHHLRPLCRHKRCNLGEQKHQLYYCALQ